MKKGLMITVTTICLMALVKTNNVLSYKIGSFLYPAFKNLDPDNVFVVLTIHHISQAVIAFLLIYIIARTLDIKIEKFGFNTNKLRFSIKAVLLFVGAWTVIQAGMGFLFVRFAGISSGFHFPLTVRNFAGYFLFQILLSGTSEEIVFRALVITVMLYLWKDLFASKRQLWITAVLASTLVFMFDHINFSFVPFRVLHFDILQQLTVFIFGVFYGYLFIKTKSIIGPILAHNLLNGVIITIQLVLVVLMG